MIFDTFCRVENLTFKSDRGRKLVPLAEYMCLVKLLRENVDINKLGLSCAKLRLSCVSLLRLK
jgi:hypothetical protein